MSGAAIVRAGGDAREEPGAHHAIVDDPHGVRRDALLIDRVTAQQSDAGELRAGRVVHDAESRR